MREDLKQYHQKGERVYLTFLDGEGRSQKVGGQILKIIASAIIFRIKTGFDYGRTVVIYEHRILKAEGILESRKIS